jgi:hypothetical protein
MLQVAKTARQQKNLAGLPPNHNTQPKKREKCCALPCLSGPYAVFAPIPKTMRIPPTKLVGDLTHTPMVTPIEAIWKIFITFDKDEHIPTPQQVYCCFHHCSSIFIN